jgi:hypothetical protein
LRLEGDSLRQRRSRSTFLCAFGLLAEHTEQDENALADALEMFKVSNKDVLLDRTLDYLRDHVIFQAIKNFLGLEKYNFVNNLLWFAAIQDEAAGPEEVIKSYGSWDMSWAFSMIILSVLF